MNSGTHGTIPPYEVKPSSPCRCPSWKMSVIRPYAAPTDSRFSPIEISGMASERNATSSRSERQHGDHGEHQRRPGAQRRVKS